MSQRVAVVTDSAASIPEALVRRWGIIVVPLDVIIDGEPKPEGPGMGTSRVLAALNAGSTVTTSQPTVGAFVDAYRAAAETGVKEIVSVHISGGVSGTVNAAEVAAREAPIPVAIVDTRTVAMATGYSALAAAAFAKTGAAAGDVLAEARRVAQSSSLVFTVDTLEYLRRGGRVPRAVAALGDALNIRPILAPVDGEIAMVERVRSTARARERIVEMVEERLAGLSRPGLAIMGLGDPSDADDAAILLESRHPELAMVVRTPVSAVLAVHGGPGAFAAAIADLPLGFR